MNSPLLVEDIVFLKMNNIKGVTDDLSFLSCQSSLGPNWDYFKLALFYSTPEKEVSTEYTIVLYYLYLWDWSIFQGISIWICRQCSDVYLYVFCVRLI